MMAPHCVKAYRQGETPTAKPTVPSRLPLAVIRAASRHHVAASMMYNPPPAPPSRRHERARKMRSYSSVTTGAVTRNSLVAIPRAQAATATVYQRALRPAPPPAVAPRSTPYSVSR